MEAPHSSTLAWKIPWTEEPRGLPSVGLLRVGHNWATSLSLFTFMHGRRKWQPTPVFLPGKSHGQRSLVCYSLWGHKESDTTEWLSRSVVVRLGFWHLRVNLVLVSRLCEPWELSYYLKFLRIFLVNEKTYSNKHFRSTFNICKRKSWET